jgi:hypothetical protein
MTKPPVAPPCVIDLVTEREPAHLAAESSGEVVEVSMVQLGFQAGAFAGGVGSILRSPLSVGGGTKAVRFRTGADVLSRASHRCLDRVEILVAHGLRGGCSIRDGDRPIDGLARGVHTT